MRAMVLGAVGRALEVRELGEVGPGPGQVSIAVAACGVCRTDLHIVDGELARARLPLVLGHQIVGRVLACGAGVTGLAPGMRVGVPWLASTCGRCVQCARGRENLCEHALFTGYDVAGGFAERALADSRYCFALPARLDDLHVAPLLCAGMIGSRALSMCGDAERVGLYGFGAAAHIAAQLLLHEGREVYAFTRADDAKAQQLALALGARWAGSSDEPAPVLLDAAVLFAPVGALVPKALLDVAPGGSVICAGIHMSDIPSFPYASLWRERSVRSVANLTRADGERLLRQAETARIRTEITVFPLVQANEALAALRLGQVAGSIVLACSDA
jgi:propanol-preferring alcohol dehydrogenase